MRKGGAGKNHTNTDTHTTVFTNWYIPHIRILQKIRNEPAKKSETSLLENQNNNNNDEKQTDRLEQTE